jgi:26S proteasome regulatory subunit N5
METDNEIADAASILQEVQVETYGSMDKREKLEFILYQMKIMIKKLDYTRLFIISKKIEPKNLEDAPLADLKILYYSYLVFYLRHEGKYLETA